MSIQHHDQTTATGPTRDSGRIGESVHVALKRGLVIGRQVKIGIVRGVIIGYNIARRGRFRGIRYPLLIKTELGVGKFRLDEVVAAGAP